MTMFRKSLIASAASLALGAGIAFNASAAGIFTVDPTAFSTGTSQFNADFVQGNSTTRVQEVGATNNYTSAGFITFTGFSLDSNPIASGITGLATGSNGYGLYATFNQTFACPALLAPGIECAVTSISLSLFLDPGFHNVYHQATLAADPSITGTGDDLLLATVDTVLPGSVAGLNLGGGAHENVNTNFITTALGDTFFVQPVPFYNMAFSEFNNTSIGLKCSPTGPCPGDGKTFAITGESGGTQFIPEPASVGLVGLALLVAGLGRRRKG
jgi:hypothetical protein